MYKQSLLCWRNDNKCSLIIILFQPKHIIFTKGSDLVSHRGCDSHTTEALHCHSYGHNNDDRPKVITLRDLSSGGGCLGFPKNNKWEIFTSQTSQ